MVRTALAAVLALLVPSPAAAQPADGEAAVGAGSAALGVGFFGDRPATTLDLGIDFEQGALAFGIGARVRWLAGEGVRDEDWDEPSEAATALRYLSYARAPSGRWPGFAFAAGALADVSLGHGSIVGGYTGGLDVDHRSTGAQLRVAGGSYAGEAVIDDVVAPQIIGARAQWRAGMPSFAVTGAGDVEAGTPMLAVDGELSLGAFTPYADLVAARGGGLGAHLGVAADLDRPSARWRARLEGRAGTDRYVPGRIGALYEIERRAPDAMSGAGDLAGFGGLAELGVEVPDVGRLTASYARRAGLPDRLVARALAPYFRGVQLGAWAAADLRRRGERALAAEVRAQLPHGMFAVADAARLYREVDGALSPLWIATVAFGSALAF